MAARNKMDRGVKGPLEKRLGASGYPATLAVENVSAGYHTLAEAFSGWRHSPPHKANMLKSGVTNWASRRLMLQTPNTRCSGRSSLPQPEAGPVTGFDASQDSKLG